MKVMHGDPNRAEHQKVFVETADGKFKYQLFMDYAKGLPDYLEWCLIWETSLAAAWVQTTACTADCGAAAL